jgi:hypothetical protein
LRAFHLLPMEQYNSWYCSLYCHFSPQSQQKLGKIRKKRVGQISLFGNRIALGMPKRDSAVKIRQTKKGSLDHADQAQLCPQTQNINSAHNHNRQRQCVCPQTQYVISAHNHNKCVCVWMARVCLDDSAHDTSYSNSQKTLHQCHHHCLYNRLAK